jgi:hypothetical protein
MTYNRQPSYWQYEKIHYDDKTHVRVDKTMLTKKIHYDHLKPDGLIRLNK